MPVSKISNEKLNVQLCLSLGGVSHPIGEVVTCTHVHVHGGPFIREKIARARS